ncbi:unnamed protein product [Nesidiocoris tenuis]|uniref:Uncharacterized protein n=1 Tax=Nesidiocoris tenuis TaxID=355587 RepID=A0A6H5HPQ0_9HEMI|nr:unnamed protein product [Nesidiocoris tenuis]
MKPQCLQCALQFRWMWSARSSSDSHCFLSLILQHEDIQTSRRTHTAVPFPQRETFSAYFTPRSTFDALLKRAAAGVSVPLGTFSFASWRSCRTVAVQHGTMVR